MYLSLFTFNDILPEYEKQVRYQHIFIMFSP